MASSDDDPLLELLLPHLAASPPPPPEITNAYLIRLTSLPLPSIQSTEPASLSSTSHSITLSLQSLASRNYKPIIHSSEHLTTLTTSLTELTTSLTELQAALPDLDNAVTTFTNTYARDSAHLQSRGRSQLLHANLERLLDILHLPSLLQSLIAAANYPTALDTLAHVRRLRSMYPGSPAVSSVAAECEALQSSLTGNLISTLRGPLKLPAAMKTIGFLRRSLLLSPSADERGLRGLFLVCRLAYLVQLLDALLPLRKLADEERGDGELVTGAPRKRGLVGGVQTERYLKRWLEVFREQSFGVVGMYRSIFPAALEARGSSGTATPTSVTAPPLGKEARTGHSRSSSTLSVSGIALEEDPEGGGLPDPVVSFVGHLVGLLVEVLRVYLPVVEEKSVRESLLTQVLYASGSLGRLGGEFAGVLSGLEGVFGIGQEEEEREAEFVSVVGRQKVLAGRLEAMAAGRTT